MDGGRGDEQNNPVEQCNWIDWLSNNTVGRFWDALGRECTRRIGHAHFETSPGGRGLLHVASWAGLPVVLGTQISPGGQGLPVPDAVWPH